MPLPHPPHIANYTRLSDIGINSARLSEVGIASPTGPLGTDLLDIEHVPSESRRNQWQPRNELLDFVGESWFQLSVGVIIALNVLVFGLETDYQELQEYWTYAESIFLLIYVVELALRIMHKGVVDFFRGPDYLWNWLDACIVALGALELWVLKIVVKESHSAVPKLFGCLRLLRLLRLVRFFKIFNQLMTVVKACMDMLQSFTITFLVMAMFIIINAIFCTEMLGKAEAFERIHLVEDPVRRAQLQQEITVLFKDIPTSVFTLFRVTTTDNWIEIANPVLELDPRWGLFFILFILIAAWTMISVLTAVASDSMVAAASFRQEAEAREQEVKKKEFRTFLRTTFYEADEDGNSTLDADEFKKLIQKESLSNYMRTLGINIQMQDLERAWLMLDVDQSGELTIDEFVMGLAYLQEGLSTKHVMNIDSEIKRVSQRTEGRLNKLVEEISHMLGQNVELKDKLKEQTDHSWQQCKMLFQWLDEAQQTSPDDFPTEVMEAAKPFLKPVVLKANFDGFREASDVNAELQSSRGAMSSFGAASRSIAVGAHGERSTTASMAMTPMRSIPWMAINPS